MRKNTQQVWDAFTRGERRKPANSIWTDGDTIYSYGTALLTRKPCGMLILNATSYSVTTTIHQNSLRTLLRGGCYDSITFAPRGFSAAQLATL